MENNPEARLTAKEGRRFAFTLAAAFSAVAVLTTWREHEALSRGAWVSALAFLVSGTILPTRLGPVERAWMKFGLMLSKITSPLFLGFVYFVVLTPTALIRRVLGKNAIEHNLENGSYWKVRPALDPEARRTSMERQF